MNHYLLTYLGPVAQARADVQVLLKRFPRAFFVEKSKFEFEVNADYAFGQDIVAFERWRAEAIRIAA